MKLTLTIVRDDDANKVVEVLTEHGFYVTRLASTGGFLRMGNTVLLSGVEDDQVDQMLKIIQAHTQIHVQPPTSHLHETSVSRAVVFVLGLEQLVKL
ncbi:MAG: cyclic-di-AMP receptor [Chloroflexota bacterium]|nr:cyclic-di-AMP receptor [Chloroflexota bacterium]